MLQYFKKIVYRNEAKALIKFMKQNSMKLTIPFLLTSQFLTPIYTSAEESSNLDSDIIEQEEDGSQLPPDENADISPSLKIDESATFEKIGPQVSQATALTSAYGSLTDGTDYMYVLQHGTPSALTVINIANGETVGTFILEQSTSAWGIDVDKNGMVWIGGTSSGHFYKYDPYKKELKDIGNQLKHSKDTAILDLHIGKGRVYASTAYNGTIFSYSPETEEYMDYGQFLAGKEFAKSIFVDEESGSIFAGVGSKAELIKYHIRTKIRQRFLPAKYANEKYISDIVVVDNYLYARLDPSKKTLVFNKNSLKLVDELDVTSKTISTKSRTTGELYYTNQGMLYSYNPETLKETKLELPELGKEVISTDIVDLDSGETLVGLLSNSGDYFTYNLESGQLNIKQVNLSELPVTLYTMQANLSKEKILINGYMSGGIGVYNTLTGQSSMIKNVSQVESMAYLNNKLYLGAYPKARLLELDISDDLDNSKINELYRYSSLGQERPTALLGVEAENKLVIGTYPETSTGGGVLSIYDPVTGKFNHFPNYIPDQSIISLQESGNMIYGGTTVYANHKRSSAGATLFRFSLVNPKQKEIIPTPFKASMINSLTPWGEKYLLGMADGTIFKYNLETEEFQQIQITPLISGRFKNSTLLFGKDNLLYGTVEGILFKMVPDTMEVTVLKEEGAYDLAIDLNGVVYFRNQAEMWKYDPQQQQQ